MLSIFQSGCYTLEGVDESYEFSRLKQSMELVGFGSDVQRKLFSVLSAVLLLGMNDYICDCKFSIRCICTVQIKKFPFALNCDREREVSSEEIFLSR